MGRLLSCHEIIRPETLFQKGDNYGRGILYFMKRLVPTSRHVSAQFSKENEITRKRG